MSSPYIPPAQVLDRQKDISKKNLPKAQNFVKEALIACVNLRRGVKILWHSLPFLPLKARVELFEGFENEGWTIISQDSDRFKIVFKP